MPLCRHPPRPAYTLIELLIASASSAILMGGLASALYISSQALTPDATATDEDNCSALALAQMTADLRLALDFSERTATAVTFTVPDRNGDSQVETVRYYLGGADDDELRYVYNGAETTIADNVQTFDVSELTRPIPENDLTPPLTSVAYLSFAEKKEASPTNSIQIPAPSDDGEIEAGDLLIAALAIRGNPAGPYTLPSGWSDVATVNNVSSVRLIVWKKTATASEPSSYAFSWTSTNRAYGWVMRFSGADSISASATNIGTSSSPICPAADTTAANSLVLRIGAFEDDAVSEDNSNVSGHKTITMDASDQTFLDFGPSVSGGAAHRTLPFVGTTGTAAFGLIGLTPSKPYAAMTIVIAPDDGS